MHANTNWGLVLTDGVAGTLTSKFEKKVGRASGKDTPSLVRTQELSSTDAGPQCGLSFCMNE